MTKDIAPAATMPASGVAETLRLSPQLPPKQPSTGLARTDKVLAAGSRDVGFDDTAMLPGQAIDRAVETAAREIFADREIAVTSFQDEGSGRFVHRVFDRASGEVLMQSPPDELLRFFASGREQSDRPLVEIDV